MIFSIADFRLATLLIARSRTLLVGFAFVILVSVAAWLSSQFSPRQPATVALDVGLSFIRLLVPFWAILQVQDLLAREIERKLILSSLTYPRSRSSLLLARYAAVVAVSLVLVVVLAGALAGVVSLVGQTYAQATPVALGWPYIATCFYMMLDIAVIAAFAQAIAALSTTPNMVLLSSIGFMIAGRSASTIVALLEREQGLVKGADWYHQGLQNVMWFLPDLASLDVRSAALYGKADLLPQQPLPLVLMALGYIALMLTLGCIRFERRQFN